MANSQKIVPCLWFNNNAEEAVEFYLSVFPDSKKLGQSNYPTEGLKDFQQEFAGKPLTIDFELFGQRYTALNAGDNFTFNEAISLMIMCKDQAEIDYYWDKLTTDGGEESVCGWCKDKYGLSWQITPEDFDNTIVNDPVAFKNMMKMKKIIITDLRR